MSKPMKPINPDFKGIGFSKIGYFKEVRSKIRELEGLNMELARRHNKLEAIINSMTSGLTILDSDLNIIFANRVQMAMFPDVSLIGKECFRVFFRKNKRCRDCPALKTFENREIYRGEILIKEGEFAGRYLEWTTSPIQGPLGQVSEIVLLMRDITRRKEAEFKFLQADRMAAVGLLAASVAHEINNPLTSIAGFSEGLLKRIKNSSELRGHRTLEVFREYLEIIFNEAYRCKDIIQNVLEYSKQSSHDTEILELDQIIKVTVSLIRQHAKDNKIKITVKNSLATGFNRIVGNESQLKHLFLNLYTSAFQSMQAGAQLTTVARNFGNVIEIVISVVGESVPDRNPGETGESCSPRDNHKKDASMDLSVCYSIMRHHNGDLRFQSHGSGGFSFTLRFPAIMT